MKFFGTVKSFDAAQGRGSLQPETGGDQLAFEKSGYSWGDRAPPEVGQRLSYDKGTGQDRQPCAMNLQTI